MERDYGIPEFDISVSGISSAEQIEAISDLNRLSNPHDFSIAIGFQLSNKSVNQGTQNPRQPKFSDLRELHERTYGSGLTTAIHYFTRDNSTTLGDLEKVADAVRPGFTLVQLNTLPPSEEILKKARGFGFEIILPVAVSNKQSPQGGYAVWKGEDVQDVKSGDVSELIYQISERKDSLLYALFDPSHGTNLSLDLSEDSMAIRFGKEIVSREDMRHLNLVYAGGINPENVKGITRTLNSFFPGRFSVDIESGVRDDENRLDLNLVKKYLEGYTSAFE